MEKVIMHYDMDAFFASVEIRDFPQYKNKPLVVGKSVVTTASYEARKYGIHSAMPTSEARSLCPSLIVVNVHKEKYSRVSSQIKELVRRLSPHVEFISLDEGFVDITEIVKTFPSKEAFAKKFKERIFKHTQLTCSVGIGYNKLTAKIASDINKPGGIHIFNSEKDFSEWSNLKPIKLIPGAGKRTVNLLKEKGFTTFKDLKSLSLRELQILLGLNGGERLFYHSQGIDFRKISNQRKNSSIGGENTFRYPLTSMEEVKREFSKQFPKIFNRLKRNHFKCKTIVIKIRFVSRKTITRSKTLDYPTNNKTLLFQQALEFLNTITLEEPVKLFGVSLANLVEGEYTQLKFKETKGRR